MVTVDYLNDYVTSDDDLIPLTGTGNNANEPDWEQVREMRDALVTLGFLNVANRLTNRLEPYEPDQKGQS